METIRKKPQRKTVSIRIDEQMAKDLAALKVKAATLGYTLLITEVLTTALSRYLKMAHGELAGIEMRQKQISLPES